MAIKIYGIDVIDNSMDFTGRHATFTGNVNITGQVFIENTGDVTEDGTSGALIIGSVTGINLGIDGNEIQARDGDSASTLNIQKEGGATIIYGALDATTLNTGQGDNNLYSMDQNVLSNSNVQFTSVNTGQGYNNLYDMNQSVKTSSNVTFNTLDVNALEIKGSSNQFDSEDYCTSGYYGRLARCKHQGYDRICACVNDPWGSYRWYDITRGNWFDTTP